MRVNVLADISWETKVDHALKPLDLGHFFEEREYGGSVSDLAIIAMCRDPSLNFKQRVRYEQAKTKLHIDVMLSYPEFVAATHVKRRELLATALIRDVFEVVERKRFKAFDTERFKSDFEEAVATQLLGPDAARFDKFVLERASGTVGVG